MSPPPVAVVTPIAGVSTGIFLDDLTNPNVGGWPQTDNILRITRIVVYAGPTFIDSVEITYLLTGGPPKTVVHGGIPAGNPTPALDHTLTPNQKLVAVYGRRLNAPATGIVQLSFVFATSGTGTNGTATCTVFNATARGVIQPNTEFDFSWSLAGVVSYAKPPAGPTSYLQGLGFTEVFN